MEMEVWPDRVDGSGRVAGSGANVTCPVGVSSST